MLCWLLHFVNKLIFYMRWHVTIRSLICALFTFYRIIPRFVRSLAFSTLIWARILATVCLIIVDLFDEYTISDVIRLHGRSVGLWIHSQIGSVSRDFGEMGMN